MDCSKMLIEMGQLDPVLQNRFCEEAEKEIEKTRAWIKEKIQHESRIKKEYSQLKRLKEVPF